VLDPLVPLALRGYGVAMAIVLGVQDDALSPGLARVHLDLYLDVRVHADVKDAAMAGEPGVGPAAVVTDANGRHAIDDAQRPIGGCCHRDASR